MRYKKTLRYLLSVIILVICCLYFTVTSFALSLSELPLGNQQFVAKQFLGANSIGRSNVAVFMVDFPDVVNNYSYVTPQSMYAHLFTNPVTSENPYGNLSDYYTKSSDGRFYMSGEVFGWYSATKPRSYYSTDERIDQLVIEIINYYKKSGVDLSSFDADRNGIIDGIYLMFAGESDTVFYDYTRTVKTPVKVVDNLYYSAYSMISSPKLSKFIHEAAHQIGGIDYYYSQNNDSFYGIGGLDMMDGMVGDHNSFTKLLFGWANPTIITPNNIPTKLTIQSTDISNSCAVIFPSEQIDYHSSYYVIEYIKPTGLWDFRTARSVFMDGAIRILEVNAQTNFERNSFTLPTKDILKVIESDTDNSLQQGNTLLSYDDLFTDLSAPITIKLNNSTFLTLSHFSVKDNEASFKIKINKR